MEIQILAPDECLLCYSVSKIQVHVRDADLLHSAITYGFLVFQHPDMQRDHSDYEEKIRKLQSRISQLEASIVDLRYEMDSKDVIIDALINQVKAGKRKVSVTGERNAEEAKKSRNSPVGRSATNEASPAISNVAVKNASASNSAENFPANSDGRNKKRELSEHTVELVSQIKDIFSPKSKHVDFKPNYTFKRFVDYAENSYEFSLMNKKVSKSKNPMKMFIETNLDRLVKFLVDNINILNLNQICSTFFLINSEIEYRHKLVILHDIVLELDNYSKLGLICSALFNNLELKEDVFSRTACKILFHQFCIDSKIFEDSGTIEYLNVIRENLSLTSEETNLWDTLSLFMLKSPVFTNDKLQVRAEVIERGFALRMLCHYLDWSYTYNTFIVSSLYPRLSSERSPVFVYYFGILAVNAARMFRRDESVISMFEELRNILEWRDECSIVAYMILKQFFEIDCDTWIEENRKAVEGLGFEVDYLKKTLLL